MALTEAQIAYIRTEIGRKTPPTDDDLEEIYDRQATSNVVDVVWEVLATRLSDFRSDSATFGVSGEVNWSNTANITALERQLERIRPLVSVSIVGASGLPAVQIVQPVTPDPR